MGFFYQKEFCLHTRQPGTEVTGWVSFSRRNFAFLIYTSTGGGGLGVCFFCDGLILGVAEER